MECFCCRSPTLSEEIAHPTVYHHFSQLSVDIQLSRLIKCREDLGVQMHLTQVIFCSLGWISPESTVLMQLTQVIFHSLYWSAIWVYCSTGQKLQLSQLPNQHGTTWAVTSTAQWANCFWEYWSENMVSSSSSAIPLSSVQYRRELVKKWRWI